MTTSRARPLPPDERRAAILAATVPLIREHGSSVSTRQIAAACGVAEGTIFAVFDDKQTLIRCAVEAALDPAPLIKRLSLVSPDLSLDARLVEVVGVMQDRLRGVLRLMSAMEMHGPSPGKHHHGEGRDNQPLLEAIAHVIAPDAGQLRRSPLELARLLRLLTFSGTIRRINDDHSLTPEEIVTVLLDGVRRPDRPRSKRRRKTAAPNRKKTAPDIEITASQPARAPDLTGAV